MRLFIEEHLNDDVRKLALAKAPEGVDLRYALQQIDGRQRAKHKLPRLCSLPDIVFPVHLSVEQCSSEETANYKRELIQRALLHGTKEFPTTLIDLTGGFGIDFIALAPLFKKAVYAERDADLCRIARHNMAQPSLFRAADSQPLPQIDIINTEAEEFLAPPTHQLPPPSSGEGELPSSFPPLGGMPPADEGNQNPLPLRGEVGRGLFFLDPARRANDGSRTFALADCTPNVIQLLPALKALGDHLLLKLSPMLDWHKAVEDIESAITTEAEKAKVTEVHIVSVKNECKELLLLVSLNPSPETPLRPRLFCANDGTVVEVQSAECRVQSATAQPDSALCTLHSALQKLFLLVPNASIMKAGCFDFLAKRYGVVPAGSNSHIFFSDSETKDFPGRRYRIISSFTLNKKDVRNALQGITHANISVRNFPLSADALRKRLKLKDGGEHFLFATTIGSEHRLFLTILV